MSDVAKTPREELECKKKYLYEYSMFFECNDGFKSQILEDDVVDLLNEQQATIEEYEDFCLNLCKFLIGKGLVDEYREEYGKEYKIITKWKGCGSDE